MIPDVTSFGPSAQMYVCPPAMFTVSTLDGVVGMFTVTLQLALFPEPSAAVAVIVALPLPTAVITPLLTVATLLLLLLQVTLLFVALDGDTAVSYTHLTLPTT